ncbi:MAG: GNAT family N-acetyltransferase [Actinomycetota bacterium]|nr:GNAT family N-acetyltransferase [Actinomycetota bacterium]
MRRRVERVVRARIPPRIYLTFDDGPDPTWTPRVAQELRTAGARATFFVIGERVAEHAEVVQALVADGHEVGLHCMRHVRHPDSTRETIEEDTREGLAVLRRLGIHPRRWRPPGGATAPWTKTLAKRHRLKLADWSIDPRDWEGALAGELLARIGREARPGGTLLLHDGLGPGAARADASQTAELIEPLIDQIRLRGWEPAPLSERRPHRRLIERAFRGPELPPAPAGFATEVVAEDDLTDDDLGALSVLLAESMTRFGHEYAGKAWRRIRPVARAIARMDGELAGQVSIFRLASKPERAIYGLGDNAVHPSHRGQGIALRLIAVAAEECWRRGAEAILGDTVAQRRMGATLGFAPVPRFRFWYERDGACHWHPNWIATIRHPEPRTRLQLEEGDF